MIAETYRELITDFDHWAFEWTVEILSTVLAFLIGSRFWRRWQHNHDVEVHGVVCYTHDHEESVDLLPSRRFRLKHLYWD